MMIPTLLLAFIVNLAPLMLGSNRSLPWAFNAMVAGGLLLFTLLIWAFKWQDGPQVLVSPINWPLALFMAAVGWIGFQIFPLGDFALAHPIWAEISPLISLGSRIAVNKTISVSPVDTVQALMQLLTTLAIGLSAYVVGRGSSRAGFLLNAFVVSASLYGLYGLYRLSTNAMQILWFDQENTGYLTATYVNRNHAATYFGLAVIVSFALLSRQWRHAGGDDAPRARERVRRLIEALPGKFGIYLFLFATLLVTLFLTGSRGGIGATLVALAALIFLQHLRARRTQFGGGAASLSGALLGLFAVLAIFEMTGTKFVERLTTFDATEGRFALWSDTVTAVSDHLWMGSGYGTFQDVFPLYRSATADANIWDKAHNDYLELFLGLGLPVALMVLTAFLLIVGQCLKGVFERRRHAIFPMIAVATSIQVGLHALVDFSLQIQAVALAFAMLLGTGLAQSYSDTAT